ncbi:Protein N-terminal glutamine amidohydrolase [Maublancomyces gigas]|uniref:Protein N-terminal glutamine amidohydrolase n=1 Tax=Discina gigas TaxID=1032678 RepID=A0ABR3GWM4_9PEZI
MTSTPGVFERSGLTYTSCYCEENIYCMVRDHIEPLDRRHYTVVFISNEEKCTPLFYQKAGKIPQIPVCWDYHVILIHKAATTTTKGPSSTVYDFDTTLHPFGLQFESYVSRTLYGDEGLWANPDDREAVLSYVNKHPRGFRLVAAEEYIKLFASTRKHMMKKCADESSDADGGWLTKPPDYPPIRTEASDDTMEKFLDFSCADDEYGEILDEWAFWEKFAGAADHGGGR